MLNFEVKHSALRFTQDDITAILRNFNRTLHSVQDDIKALKDWLQTQPHLTLMPDDHLLVHMLVRSKYSIEKTKTMIENHFCLRAMIPEVFTLCVPESATIREMRKYNRIFALPHLIHLNRVLFFVFDETHRKFDVYAFIAHIVIACDVSMYCGICGSLEVIIDFSESNLTFWMAFTPMVLKIFVTIVDKLYSIRCHAVRIIGAPKIGQTLLRTAISYLPKKLQERISTHVDKFDMVQFYPREQLPAEYGGEAGPYREMAAHYDKMVDECAEYLRELNAFEADPKLRPAALTNDELLGFYGSFRQLDVD